MKAAIDPEQHRRFLNGYYGASRHFYDFTRKYYLLGRDRELRRLLNEDWQTLVEIGPGTGRNLRCLFRARPTARFGGVEASDEMLAHARKECPFAKLEHGFAEDADLLSLLETPPERILLSYCLSMVQDPYAALKNAVNSLSEDGEVVIVDFGDFVEMPKVVARAIESWLGWFHVTPQSAAFLEACGARLEQGPGRYYVRARITRTDFQRAAAPAPRSV